MAVHRTKSSQRSSPEAERLVADAISLAASGSQIEDRFWEERLNVRLMRLLKSQNQNGDQNNCCLPISFLHNKPPNLK